jgi:AraC family transcriptional regulator
MLRYFAHGKIRWKNSMRCNTRTNWEFYAVTNGRCGLRFADGGKILQRERTLWLFAPECSHAWANLRQQPYERISMHFGSVPYPLDEVVRQNGGWIEKTLSDADIVRLGAIARDLEPAFCQPNFISPLLFQRHLADLSLLMLEGREFTSLPPALTDLANFKIERAVSWYVEHLAQNPTVKQVADAIHISPSHLRRLFWQSRKTNPKTIFRRLRLDRAKELMSRSSLTLDDVAAHSGYSSASHLCRDCRAVHGFSPTTWRKKLIDRFIHPLPINDAPLREFSARPEERTMPA